MLDYELMGAITRAFAPIDTDFDKEWTCVGYIIEINESERVDDRNGGWELKQPNLRASRVIVTWSFLGKIIERQHFSQKVVRTGWTYFTTKRSYFLDAEFQEALERELK